MSDARQQWEEVAPQWERGRELLWDSTREVSEWLVAHLRPTAGQTILDLAAGTGETGFLAAPALLPDGKLITSDIATHMLEAAQRVAGLFDVRNVEFRLLDAHDTVQKLLHAKPTDGAGSILQDEAEQGFGAYSDMAAQMATADAADPCKLILGKSAALNRELGGKAAVAFHRYLTPSGELAGYDDTVLQSKLYPRWLKSWVKGTVGPRASLPRCN